MTVAAPDTRVLEGWLAGQLSIGPRRSALSVAVTGLDAVTAQEIPLVLERLRTTGPRYHAGGPGARQVQPNLGMVRWAPYTEFGTPDPRTETYEAPAGPVLIGAHGYRGDDIIIYWKPATPPEAPERTGLTPMPAVTVDGLIAALQACPADAVPYVGKGMGPVTGIRIQNGEDGTVFVILDPMPA
jgi:hypothetical protein